MTIRRPTFREAKRVYNLLTQISPEISKETTINTKEDVLSGATIVSSGYPDSSRMELRENLEIRETIEASSSVEKIDNLSVSSEEEMDGDLTGGISTALHEAAMSGNAQKVLELLEQGLDPCIKDERGRTPYMLASEKEVRNTFRRFMASNLDKWDWQAAKVPGVLTKEMEESQAAKQVLVLLHKYYDISLNIESCKILPSSSEILLDSSFQHPNLKADYVGNWLNVYLPVVN